MIYEVMTVSFDISVLFWGLYIGIMQNAKSLMAGCGREDQFQDLTFT